MMNFIKFLSQFGSFKIHFMKIQLSFIHWEKMLLNQKHVYHGFKSICYRISNIFIGSCSIFLWIHSIHAFDSIAFFSQCNIKKTFRKSSTFFAILRSIMNNIKFFRIHWQVSMIFHIRIVRYYFSWIEIYVSENKSLIFIDKSHVCDEISYSLTFCCIQTTRVLF